jgi:hypothetical protein
MEGWYLVHSQRELPGDVVASIREAEGYLRSVRIFAELLGFSYDTLRRMEMVKWGSSPETWERLFDYQDLQAFVNAGFVQEGDERWHRFKAAFVRQHEVRKYGENVYTETGEEEPIFAPASPQHISLLVQMVITRDGQRFDSTSTRIGDVPLELIVEKLTADIVMSMTMAGLASDDAPEEYDEDDIERTRAIQDQAATEGYPETPYLRTLRLAYELAEDAAGVAFGPAC